MEAGADVIVQGAFRSGDWVGRTDVLLRVEKPSALGAWSYEIVDAKLARETKGGTVLQLCLYSELLAAAQGVRPETAYVVTPHSGGAGRRGRRPRYPRPLQARSRSARAAPL